jgi:hypothetical protein
MKSIKLLNVGWALAALLLAGGCRVEERMVWAPDGTRAAVRLPEGLCLMDADGKLASPLSTNVTAVAWLPDSRGLVLVRSLAVSTWADGARLLPSNETATVEALARGLLDTLRGALAAADGDAAAIEAKFIKPLNLGSSEFVIPALICLQDAHRAELEQLVRSARNNAELEKTLAEPHGFTINELAVYRLDGAAPLVLERTLAELGAPRPAPHAPVVAFLRGTQLVLAPLAGGTNALAVADRVVGSPDWTPEGQALVYAVYDSDKWAGGAVNLFRLERRSVLDEHDVPKAGDVQALAQAAANFVPRVRCLPDGRVLFAGLALQLPATGSAKPEAHFYLVRDAETAPTAIPSPAGALPQDLSSFAPSPDGRRIAIANDSDDRVIVLDVASGAVDTVAPQRVGKNRTLPAWRGPNELYFAAFPTAEARRSEWLRWSPGTAPQVISRAWSDGSVTNLVEK